MYCPDCDCEFAGLFGKCPVCKSRMKDTPNQTPQLLQINETAYDELVQEIRDHQGLLRIDVESQGVVTRKRFNFPYFGFGYAWEKGLVGTRNGFSVQINPKLVVAEKKMKMIYKGYGFAWVQEFSGYINQMPLSISATLVKREQSWMFPYFGYGRAWAETMEGKCGERIRVTFNVTKVGKGSKSGFPYRGYGFGWVDEGTLEFSLE